MPLPLILLVLPWVAAGVVAITGLRALVLALARVRPRRDPHDDHFDILCISHVAWGHIWQRNHHTMTRLARQGRRVVYCQLLSTSPLHAFLRHWPGTWRMFRTRQPGLTLLHPLLIPGESRIPAIAALNRWILVTLLRWHEWRLGMRNSVLYFYHPQGVDLIDALQPVEVVYDIQDEYTAFRAAATGTAQREQKLLARAGVMLAGTHALYESKKPLFGGTEAAFYPCAVEYAHFHRAAPPTLFQKEHAGGLPVPAPAPELAAARGAVLFYMGLIDKRIDPEVIRALAMADPTWTIALAGPVEPGAFPQAELAQSHPNILFLGQQPYARLPEFLVRADVCLMPRALNDLTRHINPTKTLEYLATGRPVVSIRLPDLEAFFADTVSLTDTPAEFVQAIRQTLAHPDEARAHRGLAASRLADWDEQVAAMANHIRKARSHTPEYR